MNLTIGVLDGGVRTLEGVTWFEVHDERPEVCYEQGGDPQYIEGDVLEAEE